MASGCLECHPSLPGSDIPVLTKRPERIEKCLPSGWGSGWKNVWLGATAENQEQREEITAKDAYIERLQTAIEDALSYPDVDETMCPWCEMVDALEVK